MDYEQGDSGMENSSENMGAIPPRPAEYYQPYPPQKPRRSGWRIVWGIITAMSVLGNFFFLLIILGMAAMLTTTHKGIYEENLVRSGDRSTKIAVIDVHGIIDDDQYRGFKEQLKNAKKDNSVKAVILNVSSPGGMISSSDQIYNEISDFQHESGKPVVSFMQGVAASGGYYVSAACEQIVSEPTCITGSIGVIMGYLVLEELLEGKLGIQPVVVKSGEKKDWPSSFSPPTEEQLQYLQDRLIQPAFRRFVEIVADSRPDLTIEDVNRLADGSIYTAEQALDEKLIDEVGYMDAAIEIAADLAEIENPHVIRYEKPFSFSSLFEAQQQTLWQIDRNAIFELASPQVMYLWTW